MYIQRINTHKQKIVTLRLLYVVGSCCGNVVSKGTNVTSSDVMMMLKKTRVYLSFFVVVIIIIIVVIITFVDVS